MGSSAGPPHSPAFQPGLQNPSVPPEWSDSEEGQAYYAGGRPRGGGGVVLILVLAILLAGSLGVFFVVLEFFLIQPDSCGACGPTPALTMTATTGGICQISSIVENTYSISIGGATETITTSNFGLSLTEAGASTATAPGQATIATNGTCYATPPPGGWYVLLIPPGGTGNSWAIYTGSSWQECVGSPNAPCSALSPLASPVTLSGGMTFLITASPSVNLVQATIAMFGTSGASITGSVTL